MADPVFDVQRLVTGMICLPLLSLSSSAELAEYSQSGRP